MWPLLFVGFLMWSALILRALDLLRPPPLPEAEAASRAALGRLEVALLTRRFALSEHAEAINALVVAAPLLGLLGTVSGMVSTFEALDEMALFSQSGGIAGGIAEALTTTQMGLVIALPGMFTHRYLERQAARQRQRVDEALGRCRSAARPHSTRSASRPHSTRSALESEP
ncbi:MotA/TolQ/ExbB proton channel family protein [Myxococcota bacterium]|nr:MotA/TolQ/ExbB proton channel family protein [Myxococcota bacterium]MBU1429249.1 MotA/TolQ/ExbB proton channel family protein [Myxococcota bacterium]MBU1898639.1 MotA/TolQ/ExbB proton channel family protein [Myxococcota bacterium]